MQQRGGKYVSRGSYGCVFLPPVKCSNGGGEQNAIGKVFKDAHEAEEEERNHREVQRIDPYGIFTVRLLSKCVNMPKSAIMGEPDAEACTLLENRETFTQLTFENGGMDVYKMLPQMQDHPLESWAPALETAFYGLCALEKAGVVHRDLSAGNLLYDADRNRFVLIDFGMSTQAHELYGRESEAFRHRYAWYPPEFKLMVRDVTTFDTFYEMFRSNFGSDIGSLETMYGRSFAKDLSSLYYKFIGKRVPRSELFGAVWNRVDVYSIGITLFMMLGEVERNGLYTNRQLLEGLKDVVRGMIRMNPWTRFTPRTAFAAYDSVAKKHLKGTYRGVLFAAMAPQAKGLTKFTRGELEALCQMREVTCPKGGKREALIEALRQVQL